MRVGVAFREDLTSPPPSIREFCDVNVPILMFDKNANFVVKTVQEVPSPPSPPKFPPFCVSRTLALFYWCST